jgi:GntR family transcriptional regulator, transcriptional repressor for pyruvate dehydrogenase complex
MDLFPPQKKASAVDFVIGTIKNLVLTKKLCPGDRLPGEMELASRFEISRGSIREAMKILSAFGIVEIRQGDGTYIARSTKQATFEPFLFSLILTETDPNGIVELRLLIETGIVKLIIQKSQPKDLRELSTAIEEMEGMLSGGVSDATLLAQCDIRFHHAMGRATQNPLVEKIYNFVLDFFYPNIEEVARRDDFGPRTLRLHKAILSALQKRNVERAVRAIEDNLTSWRQRGWS